MHVAGTANAWQQMPAGLGEPGDVIMNRLEILSVSTDFSAILGDSITDGMKRVMGAGGTEAILFHLDLAGFDDAGKFHEKLSEIFGSGTEALERVILKELHQKARVPPASTSDVDFVNQVELARKGFEATIGREGRQIGNPT
jgi:hypothetical protein